MERPTLYYEKNVFCLEPLTKKGKFNIYGALPQKLHLSASTVTELHPSNPHSLKCREIYIQNVAGDLHFSKEVIKNRGLASLSYGEWDAREVYDPSNVIPQKGIRHRLEAAHLHGGRVQTSGLYKKFKTKSCIGFGNSLGRKPDEDEDGGSSYLTMERPKIFLTEEAASTPRAMSDDSTGGILKKMPKPTAQWIVGHHIEGKDDKERISRLTNDGHMTEEDFTTVKELETYKPKDQREESKAETLLPVFYKIPGYLLPQKQVQEVGVKNKTAESLAIKHFELPPPLRLQDLMNAKAGKYVYATENDFERELYSGVGKIIHQRDPKPKNCIVMENSSTYEKHVQPSVPRSYKEWITSDGHTDVERPLRPKRGALRWVALPTVVADKMKQSPQNETSTNVLSDRNTKPKEIQGPINKKQVLQNIVTQWRSAWLLSVHWKDTTLEQLTRDLGNIHNSQKISALITMASSAIEAFQPIVFPAEILRLVCSALREEDGLVRMAAALCQYLIQEVSEEARKIMFNSLQNGTDADSWAAAQCLALEANHSYLVIKRILEQMFAATNKETEEQALYLLRKLSKHTNLVHAMLGEALNSGNWGERIMSCKALSILHGTISQGVKSKLSHLMWNDWSNAVRGAAAKALGKLDQGKEVHDQIRMHLESDSWKDKVEALTLIGFLHIMTAQLLPGFLDCFINDFIAVRRQACRTAGLLRIKDDMVMDCLYQLVQNDPVWKIKAHGIKALGKIGYITPRVKELMLRAMRVDEPGVRIEAYRCIATLNLCDGDIQHALQDRMALESNELASREVKQTLTALNVAPKGNQEMMAQVKHQLSKLCQKEVLFPKVLKVDEDEASGKTEPDQTLPNSPKWKHRIQEQEPCWDNVGKALSGQSCPSVMSGMEYNSTDSELQVLMETDSRPASRQTVDTTPVTSELSFTTRPNTDMSQCNQQSP
ncbi:HEAT repeat-containing protein 4 [Dendropsophus ebraccatus]|uniref:HEAT repeat-containing protein 4 n=1 Tax=Dendropsophus ebraccatus TaxID=150705 RepID=UPI00383101A6